MARIASGEAGKAGAELADALERAGIRMDVDRFVDLIREALTEVGRRSAEVSPVSQLTASDIEELRAGGLNPSASLDAYNLARARTAAQTGALLASSMSVAEAADRLGVDASRVRQLLAEHALLGVKDGGEWRILDIQFQGARLVPNLGRVAKALPIGIPPLGVVNWLTVPDPDLEIADEPVSPLEWLSSGGDPERVAALAADL